MSGTSGFDRAGGRFEPAFPRFNHPIDVLQDRALSSEEKRAILSAWASDAWAVPSMPSLRRPPELAHPIAVEAILDALNSLDGPPEPRPGGATMRPARLGRAQWPLSRRLGRPTRRYLERHVFKPPGEVAAVTRVA